MTGLILISSVLVQLATAFIAVRLIKVTGNRISWGLISMSIFFMAVRRSISLFQFLSGTRTPGLSSVFTGLITSVLMLAGVLLIAPLFRSMADEIARRKRTEEALSRSEKILSSITSNLTEGIYVFDESGRLTFMNPEAERLLGWTMKELNERGAHDLVHFRRPDGSPLPFEECAMHNVIATGGRYSSRDEVFVRKDGTVFPISVVSCAIRDNGRVTSSVTAFQDITEQKRAEEELRRHREQLEEMVADRAREVLRAAQLASIGELAAGVAHEINNPITGIINYAQILANKSAGPKEKDIAERIIKEGNRIAAIVHSLLSFGRKGEDERKPVFIGDILSEALTLSETQMRKEGIRIIVDVDRHLCVRANPQQLQQVFLNLLSNARYALNLKYPAAHDDKAIDIRGETIMADDKPHVRIIFLDNGTGIPSRIIDKVKNPFYTTKPAGYGTGLGLSVSHEIIRDHGGSFAIESEEGRYTRATIELPGAVPD